MHQDHIYVNRDSGGTGMKAAGASEGIYGLGFIGAVVYYILKASTIGGWLVGFLKALVWPAFLVYDLMKFLQM
ncbi:MAG: hypothetical protein ABRQ24_00670 [Syntrophomonadaceae bacterium]